MKVPPSTICALSDSSSSTEPSTQWILAGWVSCAIFSTQRRRCSFRLKGTEESRTVITLLTLVVALAPSSWRIVIRRPRSNWDNLESVRLDSDLTDYEKQSKARRADVQ